MSILAHPTGGASPQCVFLRRQGFVKDYLTVIIRTEVGLHIVSLSVESMALGVNCLGESLPVWTTAETEPLSGGCLGKEKGWRE